MAQSVFSGSCGNAGPETAYARSILIVGADPATAGVLRPSLEHVGFRVIYQPNEHGAPEALNRRRYDLVLLELTSRGADGWNMCRHMQASHADIPVIIIGARLSEQDSAFGLDLGADDVVAKPFSTLELVARVRALLRRTDRFRAARPPGVVFGRHVLNTLARTLLCDGLPVPLTQREFALLAFLAGNPGQALSRDDLIRRVWGEAFDGYEHTINSHVNRLRSKIEADPRNPRHIITVWGVGYRFEPMVA